MTSHKRLIDAKTLRELVSYDPETGAFARLAGRCAGERAGSVGGNGYRLISIENRRYSEHRIAWLYVHGIWPAGQIDHIDGDKTNNRIANLRDVSASENKENLRRSPRNAEVGMLGVRRMPRNLKKPFQARIKVNGKQVHIGYFASAEAAHSAYLAEKRRLHVGCTI